MILRNFIIDTISVSLDYGLSTYRTRDFFEEYQDEKTLERKHKAYRAPEGTFTEEADVYAYGVIVLEIATRNDPYEVCSLLLLI